MRKVAVSLLACDFSNLKEELKKISTADYIHIDVMDGHFAPNFGLGVEILKAVKKHTKLPIEVHLMITDPAEYAEEFCKYADCVSVHVEANEPEAAIDIIKKNKKKAGIILNPETPPAKIQLLLDKVDYVLVMTVHPGFSAQEFIKTAGDKTKLVRPTGKEIWVDGGINEKTKDLVEADVLCAGNYIFSSDDPKKAIAKLKE